ncbi:MAG: glycosyltransferase, partial [Nitrospinae bacterium]|nr:glycosyltransferase [Nitrospinota bacterium]
MEKLSVTIITFNEEKNIRDCLESVKWADEIVVIDSFSTDKTLEICREYTDNVYQNKWPGFVE